MARALFLEELFYPLNLGHLPSRGFFCLRMCQSIPTFPQFRSISIYDQAHVDELMAHVPPSSDLRFLNVWSWDTESTVEIAELHGNIVCILRDYHTRQKFLSFIGSNRVQETIETLISYIHTNGEYPHHLALVHEGFIRECLAEAQTCPFSLEEDRDNFDYIFSIPDLASLQGKPFATVRNLVNRCRTRCAGYRFEAIDIRDTAVQSEVLDLFDRWGTGALERGAPQLELDVEKKSFVRYASYQHPVPIKSFAIYMHNQIIAFGTNELANTEYVMAYYRKAERDKQGLFQLLEHETAKELVKTGHKYLNYQQDLGILSLRQSKEGYRPVDYVKKYIIT